MFPSDDVREDHRDPGFDFVVLAYAGSDGVSERSLMAHAFRPVADEDKRRALTRLRAAGLVVWTEGERIERTSAGHAAARRIVAAAQRRGWQHYEDWVGALLYSERSTDTGR